MIEEEIRTIKKLKENNTITYEEILEILEAFQIASAQGYAIGKTKGILNYIKNYGKIIIEDHFDNQKITLMNNHDLSEFYKKIDNSIDIEIDPAFITYFK